MSLNIEYSDSLPEIGSLIAKYQNAGASQHEVLGSGDSSDLSSIEPDKKSGSDAAEGSDEEKAKERITSLERENLELQLKLSSMEEEKGPSSSELVAPSVPQMESMPSIEDSDYDEVEWRKKVSAWMESRDKAIDDLKKYERRVNKSDEDIEKTRNDLLRKYEKSKLSVKEGNYASAEDNVLKYLSKDKQWAILQAFDNPASIINEIGSDLSLIKKFSVENNLAKFISDCTRLEIGIKKADNEVKPSSATFPSESKIRGSSGGLKAKARERELESLKGKAVESRDFTEYLAALNS